jgi:hypothetical protein
MAIRAIRFAIVFHVMVTGGAIKFGVRFVKL